MLRWWFYILIWAFLCLWIERNGGSSYFWDASEKIVYWSIYIYIYYFLFSCFHLKILVQFHQLMDRCSCLLYIFLCWDGVFMDYKFSQLFTYVFYFFFKLTRMIQFSPKLFVFKLNHFKFIVIFNSFSWIPESSLNLKFLHCYFKLVFCHFNGFQPSKLKSLSISFMKVQIW